MVDWMVEWLDDAAAQRAVSPRQPRRRCMSYPIAASRHRVCDVLFCGSLSRKKLVSDTSTMTNDTSDTHDKLQIGSASSPTFSVWQRVLGEFDEVVASTSSKGASLVPLERWWLSVAPSMDSTFGRDELIQLIKWKGQRGKFRPALVRYAADMDDRALRSAVQAALSHLRQDTSTYLDVDTVEKALAPLLELRGVGPATGSAILAAFDDRIPFMADSLLEALHDGVRKYTKASYLDMFHQLQQVQRSVAASSDGAWCSLRDMERVVFVESLRREKSADDGKRVDDDDDNDDDNDDDGERQRTKKKNGAKKRRRRTD